MRSRKITIAVSESEVRRAAVSAVQCGACGAILELASGEDLVSNQKLVTLSAEHAVVMPARLPGVKSR